MGYARPKPERLADKLLQIRNALGLSQSEMMRRMGAEDLITYQRISEYELGKSEPSLMVLLRYARTAGVPTEILIDDELDLPERLPFKGNHEKIRETFASQRRKR
jgi:transcriptional regulator with XRE-family HTH domain